MSTTVTEDAPIDVAVFRSPDDGALVVQIDTEQGTGERCRVNLNDGVLFDGNPETDDSDQDALLKIQGVIASVGVSSDKVGIIRAVLADWKATK